MSMHEIEDLVESSVLAVAQAPPPGARDICYSLYRLQDRFDCGYTVLRVAEELEKLGFLFCLPAGRLPEPERGQTLAGEDFLGDSPQTYFDAEEGTAFVTAGSPLWEKLCRAGVLTGPAAGPVKPLPLWDLAEQIARLAAGQEDENAACVLGYWYALFPVFLTLEPDGEADPRTRQVRDLLAEPRAFVFGAQWRLLPSPEQMDELGELDPGEREWLEPYGEWAASRAADPEVRRQLIVKTLEEENFEKAVALAARLPDEAERDFYRALAALGFYRRRAATASGEEGPEPEGLMTLPEARDTFASLADAKQDTDWICRLYQGTCLTLLGEAEAAYEATADAFSAADRRMLLQEDEWSRGLNRAILSVSFYTTVRDNIPDAAPGKERMMNARAGEMLTLPEARRTLGELMGIHPEQDWLCRFHLGLSWLAVGDREAARRELLEAGRLQPGEPMVRQALADLEPGGNF